MNTGSLAAIGRHLLTFAMGGVSVLATLHVVSSGDATTIANSITQISNGLAAIVAAIAPMIAIASGAWASWTASNRARIAAVNATPGIKVVNETSPGAMVTTPPPR